MAEVMQRDIESDESRSGELKDLIDYWVEVIDDWVAHLDQGMGGTAQQGGDPEDASPPPDPLPRTG